jgi:hypothetical protein
MATDGYAANDPGVRDQLAEHHTHLGIYLADMGRNMQGVSAEWEGPASDGFETYRKQLVPWCQAGQNFLDSVAFAQNAINDQYNNLNNQATNSYTANAQ